MINLQDYLQNQIQDLNQFYSKLGIKPSIESMYPLQSTRSQSTFDDVGERNVKSAAQFEQNNNEFLYNSYHNPFDDIPIKAANKPIEAFIEEVPKVQQSQSNASKEKKTFLKKGTRQYLSNAQVRSELQKKEFESMMEQNGEQLIPDHIQQMPLIERKKPIGFLQKGKGKNCISRHSEKDDQSAGDKSQLEIVEQQHYGSPNTSVFKDIKIPNNEIKQEKVDPKLDTKQDTKYERIESEKIRKQKASLEQQQRQFQKQVEEWQRKMEQEKQEFERWKEEEKKKINNLRKQALPQKQQTGLSKKQLEELEQLRKLVINLQEELAQQRNVSFQSEKMKSRTLDTSKEYIKPRSNSYAMMHQKNISIDEHEEDQYEDEQDQEDQNLEQLDITDLWPNHQISIQQINKIIQESEFEYLNNKYYKKYVTQLQQNQKIINQTTTQDGKVTKIYQNGKKEVLFHNGVRREVFPDNYVIVHFTNSDIKQTFPDGTVIYFFSDAKTTQTTFPNGPNIYRFANGQIEIHFQDGQKQIRFSDGTQKFIYPNGEEETLFVDGIFQRIDKNKVKTIEYPNGSQDIFYPDGRKERKSAQKK